VLHSTFELLQKPMGFVLVRQACSVELLFVFANNVYVNKSLNEICSSYKATAKLKVSLEILFICVDEQNEQKSYGFGMRLA